MTTPDPAAGYALADQAYADLVANTPMGDQDLIDGVLWAMYQIGATPATMDGMKRTRLRVLLAVAKLSGVSDVGLLMYEIGALLDALSASALQPTTPPVPPTPAPPPIPTPGPTQPQPATPAAPGMPDPAQLAAVVAAVLQNMQPAPTPAQPTPPPTTPPVPPTPAPPPTPTSAQRAGRVRGTRR